MTKKLITNELAIRYSKLDLPRYVWLAEISLKEQVCSPVSKENGGYRTIVGEIVIDATGADDVTSVIAVHFPGYLIVNGLYDHDFEGESQPFFIYRINNDSKYESYDRSRKID